MKLLVFVALVAVVYCASPRDFWQKGRKAPADLVLKFTIAVKQNQEGLKRLDGIYWDITNPLSSNYSRWLSIQDIMEMTTDRYHLNKVLDYTNKVGLKTTAYGDFVEVEATVKQIELVFKAEMYYFQNIRHGGILVRTDVGEVPEELKPHIDFVSKLTGLPPNKLGTSGKSNPNRPAASPSSNDWVVPQTLRTTYNIPENINTTNSKTQQAVVEYGTVAGISITDLFTFQSNCNIPKQNISYVVGPFKFQPINGIDGESTLDTQYIISMAPNTATSFWTVDGWIYDFTTLIQQRQTQGLNIPWVFSMSYAWAESDQCAVTGNGTPCSQLGGTSQSYVTRTNTELQKIGATGLSLQAASGDAGAEDKLNQLCDQTNPPLNPDYPACSPYILAVGATMLISETTLSTSVAPPFCSSSHVCAGGGSEVVCQYPTALITSGGGFSNYAAAPSFQSAPVNAWSNSGAMKPPASYYNASGRAYPDVAANGHHYYIEENGEILDVDGTSASTPVFSGIISLLNDWRFNNGKNSLGPLNQLIYTMASASPSTFNDITQGNNAGTEEKVCPYGYGASVGWDPTTGWGTPNYQNMLSYVKTLQ